MICVSIVRKTLSCLLNILRQIYAVKWFLEAKNEILKISPFNVIHNIPPVFTINYGEKVGTHYIDYCLFDIVWKNIFMWENVY